MWRLYGGNARGICMVFSFKSQQNSVLKKIQYVAKEDDIIKRLNSKRMLVLTHPPCFFNINI